MIYMNNAATGYPKFPQVIEAVKESLERGVLSSRRASASFEGAAELLFSLRKKTGAFIHAEAPHEICFTSSDTIALNMLMQGLPMKEGDVLLIDRYAHNSIARPAEHLKMRGMKILLVDGDVQSIRAAISRSMREGKKIVGAFLSHASNVTGDVIDAKGVGEVLHEWGIPFVLDVAQSIGAVPIDVEKFHLSAMAFAGHKLLNAPQGTGGFYVRKGVELFPIIFGGTGSESMSLSPDVVYPDSFEVGTPAMHDLAGLSTAFDMIDGIGRQRYAAKLRETAQYAYDGLSILPSVIVYGDPIKKTPVISFNINGMASREVGEALAREGIVCRTGIHCAALAIKELGVLPSFKGTVRVSFGWYTTERDIEALIRAVRKVAEKAKRHRRGNTKGVLK